MKIHIPFNQSALRKFENLKWNEELSSYMQLMDGSIDPSDRVHVWQINETQARPGKNRHVKMDPEYSRSDVEWPVPDKTAALIYIIRNISF
ncbi:unnamed protein product [Colias eurytheme]|nr:unnamed protein product [Colias eurytheme]